MSQATKRLMVIVGGWLWTMFTASLGASAIGPQTDESWLQNSRPGSCNYMPLKVCLLAVSSTKRLTAMLHSWQVWSKAMRRKSSVLEK